ncbi:MAG TPA: ribonuclease Y, partial [Candidatus Magasanikbacteria bacterium]|nr:ribonuclease Y [Candidatus Magasanikbacteria bacterium]
MNPLILLIITAFAVVIGFAVGYLWRKKVAQAQANSLEAKSEKILIETKNKQQELLLEAKDKASKIIDQAKKEEEARRVELRSIQQHLEKRENMFDAKLLEFGNREQKLQQEFTAVDKIRADVEQVKLEQIQKLQAVAQLSEEQAREELFKLVEQRSKEDLASRMIKLDREGSDAFETKARDLMTSCIQRYAASHCSETTTTSVDLPNDEMKGRIIGKEGRNIKTIEKLTGCELIVDDTPQVITVSGFNMIRRQIAKMALEKLIADGRIQPA